jgi:hypothetical protein
MLYTAQVRFDGDEIAARIGEAVEWFKTRDLPVGPFKYRMIGDSVRMRVDFADLTDASDFAEAFGGVVLGVVSGLQAAD